LAILQIIEEFVAHTKDHPALFGYDIAEAMGAPGLPNMTKHTNAIKALDPNHIVLRNEGPLDTMTYQSKNDCKFKNSSTHIGGGELDMCYVRAHVLSKFSSREQKQPKKITR